MILRDAHQSGFHGVSQPQWDAMLTTLSAYAVVGVVTETIGPRGVPFTVSVAGSASVGKETRVFYDAEVWDVEAHGTESIPTPAWKRGTSPRTSVEITWALLVHKKKGLRLLRLGGHLPAHLYRSAQLAANKAALDALGPLVQRLQAEHSPDVTTASFDLNRDMRRKSQRRIVREAFAGTGLHLVVPPKGTHGLRKIDALLTTAPLATADMLPRAKGFDHRGFAVKSCGCPK